jgi:hypothetical protein
MYLLNLQWFSALTRDTAWFYPDSLHTLVGKNFSSKVLFRTFINTQSRIHGFGPNFTSGLIFWLYNAIRNVGHDI